MNRQNNLTLTHPLSGSYGRQYLLVLQTCCDTEPLSFHTLPKTLAFHLHTEVTRKLLPLSELPLASEAWVVLFIETQIGNELLGCFDGGGLSIWLNKR